MHICWFYIPQGTFLKPSYFLYQSGAAAAGESLQTLPYMSFDCILCFFLLHSLAVREGITDTLKRAFSDPKVKCVVICGSNGVFCGGMDTFTVSIVVFTLCFPLSLDSGFHRMLKKKLLSCHVAFLYWSLSDVRMLTASLQGRTEWKVFLFIVLLFILDCWSEWTLTQMKRGEVGWGWRKRTVFYLIQVQRTSIGFKVVPSKYTQLLNRAEKSCKRTNSSQRLRLNIHKHLNFLNIC